MAEEDCALATWVVPPKTRPAVIERSLNLALIDVNACIVLKRMSYRYKIGAVRDARAVASRIRNVSGGETELTRSKETPRFA